VVTAYVVLTPGEWTAGSAPPANVPADAWTTGNKDAIGTAFSKQSNVWFTATHGTLADVLYPTVDIDNIRQVAFLITDGSSFSFDTSSQGVASSKVTDDRALTYELRVESADHHFSLVTELATDPERPVVVMRTRLVSNARLHVYAYVVPHLNGSGAGQTGFFADGRAYVSKGATWLAIAAPMGARTAGFLGHGDGYDQLHQHSLVNRFRQAGPGRVTLTWELPNATTWTTELAFGSSRAGADAALDATTKKGPQSVFDAYREGWRQYATSLRPPRGAAPLFFYSAEVIKMAEDKLHPGAIVASLALPWGDTATDDDVDVGYRKVWPRDLYHAASALLAAGDGSTAYDVLRFMGRQQRPDGSMPQNTNLVGVPIWTAQQLDETADAILLAVRLGGRASGPDIARAAEYLVANGPATQQERWEEAAGYSPATIASEIAALRAAAKWSSLTGQATDRAVAWRIAAAKWNQALESQTFTHIGPNFYLRITTDGRPDADELINLANGAGVWDQRAIADPSFLELVRLGVRDAKDPRILSSVAATDTLVRADVAGMQMFHRYPHDGYGERNGGGAPPGMGHAWPILTGERGVYTVLAGGSAAGYLDALTTLAGPERLLSEQVWESAPASPTGSARPLVWAHAEYIILAKAIATGAVDDSPVRWLAA
jgi:glucoamylase